MFPAIEDRLQKLIGIYRDSVLAGYRTTIPVNVIDNILLLRRADKQRAAHSV
jgi:hypothetical protein